MGIEIRQPTAIAGMVGLAELVSLAVGISRQAILEKLAPVGLVVFGLVIAPVLALQAYRRAR